MRAWNSTESMQNAFNSAKFGKFYKNWFCIKVANSTNNTADKMKFFIKGFFSKCDQIRSFLRMWSHLLKKSLMGNFISVQCKFLNWYVYLIRGEWNHQESRRKYCRAISIWKCFLFEVLHKKSIRYSNRSPAIFNATSELLIS